MKNNLKIRLKVEIKIYEIEESCCFLSAKGKYELLKESFFRPRKFKICYLN